MEHLYQSKYQQIFFDQETGIMHNTWKSDSLTMTPDDYRTDLIKLVNLVEKHSPTKQLINTKEFAFTIDIDLQQWTDEEVNKKNREAGVEKAAFVIAEEIFTQMSIEQAMEGNEGADINIRYFTTEEEAHDWLLE